jgi:ribose transport system substrate-binding protein
MKKFVFITAALIIALALVSCNVRVDNAAGSSAGSGAPLNRTVKNPYVDDIRIAFIPYTIGDSVGAAWGDGMERELASFPNVTFRRFDGRASAQTQVQIMTDLINQRFDAIILQSADSAALATSVRRAEDAGIPVITMNLTADTPHAGLVAMVDIEAGALIAAEIAASLGGRGNVVIIQAAIGASRGVRLEEGFRRELAKHPNIRILDAQTGDWLTERANVVMNDFLTRFPQIYAVFAHNDAMAEGASQAAEAAGRLREMVIWGADGERKALEYIENGMLTGTIYTNCYDQGATAVRLAMYTLGSDINTGALSATPIIKMSPIVVTAANVHTIGENIRW